MSQGQNILLKQSGNIIKYNALIDHNRVEARFSNLVLLLLMKHFQHVSSALDLGFLHEVVGHCLAVRSQFHFDLLELAVSGVLLGNEHIS